MKPGLDADEHLDSKPLTKSLHEKLIDIYFEEMKKKPSLESLSVTSGLLRILIEKEHLNTLIVNLYPNNEGYSLMLRNAATVEEIETARLAYEDSDILDFIDHELIPPVIIDLLDRVQNNLFYSGNIIAELRDYRHLTDNLFETHYVLLKPSDHTMLCDLNSMTSDTKLWPMKDKLMLESEMLLHTSGCLCLDPSPEVFSIACHASNYKTLKRSCLRRTIKRCSQVFLNRKKKLNSLTNVFQQCKRLLKKYKLETKNTPKSERTFSPSSILRSEVSLVQDVETNALKLIPEAAPYRTTSDNGLAFVEEFTFEADRGNGKTNLSRLTISQRPSDENYFGLLYVDRDYRDGESKGSSCRFNLGSYFNVGRYIRQFKEIFTEEGRRQVKITHRLGSEAPKVTYTQTTASDCGKTTTTSSVAAGSRADQADERPHINRFFGEELVCRSSEREAIQLSAPAPVVGGANSDHVNVFLPHGSQVTWSGPTINPSNQVASLFPIKLLPPVTLANMPSRQIGNLFSTGGNVNSGLLQINTSQLSCPSVFLSPTLENAQSHVSLSQFHAAKAPLQPQTTIQSFLTAPSLSLQSNNILRIPSQIVSQLQQKAGPASSQLQHQLQQQMQQRSSQMNVPSSFLSQHMKDARNK